MKRVLLISIFIIIFIFTSVTYASDVNGTDLESNVEDNGLDSSNVSLDDTALQSSVNNDIQDSANQKVQISKSDSIKASNIKKYYKGSTSYKATFLNKYGKKLSNTNVKITVNGKTYSKKTNNGGVVVLPINLAPGKYKVTVNNPSTGFKLTTSVKILHTIQSKDRTKVYKDGKRFYVKFLKSNGKALANQNIKFKFNGTKDTRKTNKYGYISFSIDKFKKGKYKFTFYNKDGLKKTFTYKIVTSAKTKLKAGDYTFLSKSSKYVKVKLEDQFNYRLKACTVKAKINGKTFKVKTNSKGIAKIKLKSIKCGIYKITYKFGGKKYYKASKVTKKVVVIPSKNPTLAVKSTKSFGYGANTPFKLKVTSGKIPLAKKSITLKVDGKTYKKKTNSYGFVSLPISLKIGNYTVKYSIKKDSLINAKTASSKINVKPRMNASVVWKSLTTVYRGPQAFKLLLKDSNNKSLVGKTIKLTIKSKTYKATTSSKGYATFRTNLPKGNYIASFNFAGDNDYLPFKNSTNINAVHKVVDGSGYWLKKEQFESVTYDELMSLASQGVTDIFLNSNSVSAFGKERIENWIGNATSVGIKVHFWVQVFKNNNVWTKAIIDGKVNTKFYTQKINEIKSLAQIKGISGIHLDYIRLERNAYKTPGSTDAINQFIKQSTSAVRKINRDLVLSCAIFSKMDKNEYYYGQDFSYISQYMDVVIPMVYKGNAGKSTSWITSTTDWYVSNSKGAVIWSGLQTYKSDSDITVLSLNEMNKDAKAALNGGASGLVLFRWGLTSYIDFNSLI